MCRPVLQILTLFQTKKCDFSHLASKKSIPTLRPSLRNYVIIIWIRAATKKISQNPLRIRILLFLSYSFGIETMNSSYTPVVPLKTISDSRPKCLYPFANQNGAKTLPFGKPAHTFMAYIGEYPPPPPGVTAILRAPTWNGVLYFQITKTENIFKDLLP